MTTDNENYGQDKEPTDEELRSFTKDQQELHKQKLALKDAIGVFAEASDELLTWADVRERGMIAKAIEDIGEFYNMLGSAMAGLHEAAEAHQPQLTIVENEIITAP